jgi:anti-sigma factor RsiW
MTHSDRPPTRDELLAMAYADGELSDAGRAEFEARLAHEPLLRREVAELQRLALIARRCAPPEPKDHEWRRLEGEALYGGGRRLALGLLAGGALTGVAGGGWALFSAGLPAWVEVGAALLLAGFVVLLLVAVRGRLRTLPYDPYTEVER